MTHNVFVNVLIVVIFAAAIEQIKSRQLQKI